MRPKKRRAPITSYLYFVIGEQYLTSNETTTEDLESQCPAKIQFFLQEILQNLELGLPIEILQNLELGLPIIIARTDPSLK